MSNFVQDLDDINESDIFGGMILPSGNVSAEQLKGISSNIRIFKSMFTKNVFTGVNYVLYEVLTSITKLNPRVTMKQFKSAVTNSLGILINIPEVDIEGITDEDDPEVKMKDLLNASINAFTEAQDKDADQGLFKSNIAILAMKLKKERYREILIKCHTIATEGLKHRGRFIVGSDEADKFYNSEMVVLNNMILDSAGKSMAIKSGVDGLQEVLSNMENLRKKEICSFHLDPIDEKFGSLKTSEMIAIFGPPKGGKSRTQAYLVHDALINGHNVCIFQLEGTPIEYVSMLEARHMLYLYGSNPVDDEMIQDDKVPDEWRQRYIKCRDDLYTNPKYGEFNIQPGPVYVETMEEQFLEQYYSWKPFEVLVLDYPTLVQSTTNKQEREVVASVFRRMKTFITVNKMLGIVPHQMQTESFKKLKSGLEDDMAAAKNGKKGKGATLDGEGGADSSESTKSPDMVIGIFANKEMKDKGHMMFMYVAARRKKSFKDFKARTLMGQCMFTYDESLMMQEVDM